MNFKYFLAICSLYLAILLANFCPVSTSPTQYTNGVFSLSWSPNGDSTDFKFTVKVGSTRNAWAAFAFSKDGLMVN